MAAETATEVEAGVAEPHAEEPQEKKGKAPKKLAEKKLKNLHDAYER